MAEKVPERAEAGSARSASLDRCLPQREITRTCPHPVEHRLGQLAGERILLARMIGGEDGQVGVEAELCVVPELGPGAGHEMPAAGEYSQRLSIGEAPQRHDDPDAAEQVKFPFEPQAAGISFGWGRLVSRRGAPHRCGDEDVCELEPVAARDRLALVGEACPVQSPVQPIAGPISRKHPSSAIRPVCGGREAHHEHSWSWITERRNGGAPIRLVSEGSTLLPCHALSPFNETGAVPALDDLCLE